MVPMPFFLESMDVALKAKEIFADVIKLRILRWADYLELSDGITLWERGRWSERRPGENGAEGSKGGVTGGCEPRNEDSL